MIRFWLAVIALAIAFWIAFFGCLYLAGALASCHTHRCWHRVHVKRADNWLRHQRPWVWRWRQLPAWERRWAHCVAYWETFGVPWSRKAAVATGNGYFGSTQWLPKTWHDAGGSGLPTEHSLYEQLVRTVWWARIEGPSQWSTSRRCGR